MKKLIGTWLLLLLFFTVRAAHISGGEMYYKYIGTDANGDLQYEITLRLFRDCNVSGTRVAEMPTMVIIGIFENNAAYTPFRTSIAISRTSISTITLSNPYSCIINPPAVCYQVGYFTTQVTLPKNSAGYIAAYQTCCRISFISNTVANSPSTNGDPGATYICKIPGTDILGPSGVNSSPVFSVKDTAIACRGTRLMLDFSAADPDGDSLSYSFCAAYGSGTRTDASEQPPSSPSLYNNLTYATGYSGSSPLGNDASIDPKTGIISGIAPAGGNIRPDGTSYFVVNVCINEWRNGVVISQHRKDFILKVTACTLPDAELPVSASSCDGFTYTFENKASSSQVKTWYWDFGIPGGPTSTQEKPTVTFPVAGDYDITLIVNKDSVCTDTAKSKLRVYPGFNADFDMDVGCVAVPVNFYDRTTAAYGSVNLWKWDFGDLTTTTDISSLQNSSWKYNITGQKNVRLIVGSDKGCLDTAYKSFDLLDKPPMTLAFKDTLICDIDTLQLLAYGSGTFSWRPSYNISNTQVSDPLVSPDVTTTYIVQMIYKGCEVEDSVRVRVIDRVTLDAGRDTTICLTDAVILRPQTDGLYFKWSPSSTLSRDDIKNPIAIPTAPSTTYTVVATVGKCSATDNITIFTEPYPIVDAGADHTICTDSLVQLNGTHNGDTFQWFPSSTLLNAGTLSPTAFPSATTKYYLTTRFLTGCIKPVTDTVLVTVIPPVPAFAGNDTNIVIGQPLQLTATGGVIYEWSPEQWLSNSRIFNPVATLQGDYIYSVKVITAEGCYAYDTVAVKVFFTAPDIFVPNAFTPNDDGYNDTFKPVLAGISRLHYFRIYNRWGQQVFSSSDPQKGWDGRLGGKAQSTGTFVWMAEGTDYTGKKIFKKGTLTLVR